MDWIKAHISVRDFSIAFGVIVLLYVGFFTWIATNTQNTIAKLEHDHLQQLSVEIDWTAPLKEATQQPNSKKKTNENITSADNSPAATVTIEPGTYRKTDDGYLPIKRSSDNLTVFEAYRRPFSLKGSDKPIIALGITDMGLSEVATESAIRTMPGEVSFIMSPYSKNLDFWVDSSRARGHEVWMSLPMEPKNYPMDDPGPHTLLVNGSENDNINKLHWVLSQVRGYAGVIGTKNAEFLNSIPDVRPIISDIYKRGLGYIDNSASSSPIPETIAYGYKAPYARVDIHIDETATSEAIAQSFEALMKKADDYGVAVGIMRSLPLSYQELIKWIDELSARGYIVAPLSAATGFVFSDIDVDAK